MKRGKRLIAAGICAVICFAMMFVSVGTCDTLKVYAAEGQIQINVTNFPDEKFRNYVKGFDTSGDGYLSEGEIGEVTWIGVDGKGIESLQGIEFFTSLETLICYYNNLSSLDVSKNTALTDLWCYGNNLSSLDVSKNTALTRLECYNNNLSSLDVSKNTALTRLVCCGNNLSSLDVSRNTALTRLECQENNLSSLDVSKNTVLTSLVCSENNLSSLDVNRNTALEYFKCSRNNISSLDVSRNTVLRKLLCDRNNLSSLDVSKNTALTELLCYGNELISLDLSSNIALTDLWCGGNNLSSLDVSANTALINLECNNNTHVITLSEGNTFDMSTLPEMDVSKVLDIVGGTIKGNILTVDSGVESVTYTYDCGNEDTAVFKLTFTSKPSVITVPISSAKVTLPKSSYIYTGSAITPAVTVTYDGKKLTAGMDYTVAYSNNKTVGKATVTITGKGNYTGAITKTFTIIPASTTVESLTNKTKGITIKWKKVSEAGGYYIYRSKNGGKFSRIKTIISGKTVSYTDTSATTNGAKYQYKMIAYKKVGTTTYESASSKAETIYRISAPKIKELRSKSGKKIAVKWTKNTKATGYQIQYATNSKFKRAKTVTVKKASTVSKVIAKLKKNSTYRVRVRTYKKVSGKNYYSVWSSTKSVKIRK